jgi:hypothetical protein
VGEVEVGIVEATEVGIGEALEATAPIEHEAGEGFLSSLICRRLTSFIEDEDGDSD